MATALVFSLKAELGLHAGDEENQKVNGDEREEKEAHQEGINIDKGAQAEGHSQ